MKVASSPADDDIIKMKELIYRQSANFTREVRPSKVLIKIDLYPKTADSEDSGSERERITQKDGASELRIC